MGEKIHDPLVDLTGKIAVISGGSSGIGFGTAQLLASKGAVVVILGTNVQKGEQAAEKIAAQKGTAQFIRCDVTMDTDCRTAVETISSAWGTIDILFNNAGVIRRQCVEDLSENEWDRVVDVTLKGAYLMSKYTVPVMAKNGGGSIINCGSGWGLKGGDKAAAYCAAKGGVVNLTRAMAIDHGPQGIRVNSVSPGDIDTPMLHDEARQLGEDDDLFMAAAADRPLKRVGTPADVAMAVLFFSSAMSEWVTGANLTVDGGGLA